MASLWRRKDSTGKKEIRQVHESMDEEAVWYICASTAFITLDEHDDRICEFSHTFTLLMVFGCDSDLHRCWPLVEPFATRHKMTRKRADPRSRHTRNWNWIWRCPLSFSLMHWSYNLENPFPLGLKGRHTQNHIKATRDSWLCGRRMLIHWSPDGKNCYYTHTP